LPLRHRILSAPETVQDLALAADEKYWEGIELLVAGRRGAGIYLLGYTVEMLLKSACFLIDRARPGDPVAPLLHRIQRWARTRLPRIRHESYHSLWFWVHVLRKKRAMAGRPLPPRFDSPLLQRVRRVYGIWVVDMRYKPDQALQREAQSVYDDVTWIRDRRLQWML
jgi:hypothetical protein